ncbi:hypothetical protein [Arthrobacter gengyunqii]|uniref:WXG100 family type VII secretion target n=1 Tax=Arthrobacter gengyunqii TaxID=2886940 RepID=A0ABS8GKX8_9MICC|nr:hypothetical protein [Arthrobacter gengyunqii]MCC3267331.1 hypothetical protein [Arthrobacter gengyunqii]
MPADTEALFTWASPDAVEAAAPGVGAAGQAYLTSVERTAATWMQLDAHYSGDGAPEIQEAFGTVMPHAGLLAQMADQATSVLAQFAVEIRELMAQRDALMLHIDTINQEVLESADQPEGSPVSMLPSPELRLRRAADSAAVLAGNYNRLEEETAGKLTAIVWGDHALTNLVTGRPGTVITGVMGNLAKLPSSRQTVVKIPTPSPVYIRYLTAAERMRHWARGRWVTDGRWILKSINVLEYRPKPSKMLYEHSPGYRNRVDANGSKWALPTGGWRELTKTAAGFKAGGGVLSLATAGFTIADERQDAYHKLLQEHPGMNPGDLNERADAVGLVKGGVKAGIDLSAAASGAVIGSAIGGPVGTVAGAAIGIGISVVTSLEFGFLDDRTIKDAAADTALELVDGFMESDLMKSSAGKAAREAADAVADCWNKLFGR